MKSNLLTILFCCFFLNSCVRPPAEESDQDEFCPQCSRNDISSSSKSFKIPLPKGYNWTVTQSWGEHWEYCDEKYPSDASFENDSHNTSDYCTYGWDFSLPGSTDKNKPVLASGSGVIEKADDCGAWGECVVVDHQVDNICSRYAHMISGSMNHLVVGQQVCQGLKLGEIGDTGADGNYHLHFQFEDCDTKLPIKMGFTDGNSVPKCTISNDVCSGVCKDDHSNYTFLKLTNDLKYSCDGNSDYSGIQLPDGGWVDGGFGSLSDCPLNPNCDRDPNYFFHDYVKINDVALAAGYLYGECVLDGKYDGGLYPNEGITRAETLKIALHLFGLDDDCGDLEHNSDVDPSDWFYDLVNCGIYYGILTGAGGQFFPNRTATYFEVAKVLVEAADEAGVIDIKTAAEVGLAAGEVHWSTDYLATLVYYGGISIVEFGSSAMMDLSVSRGDFVVMAASLSPCYCKNVICDPGYVCEQAMFACVNPDDDSIDTGGGEITPTGNRETDEGLDLDIDCSVVEDSIRCANGVVSRIRCDLRNNGNEDIVINDLIMSLDNRTDQSICVVTDSDLWNGAGFQRIASGMNRRLTGYFEITCAGRPRYNDFEVSFDLFEGSGREIAEYQDIMEDEIDILDEFFGVCHCSALTCQDLGFECDEHDDRCGGIINCGRCRDEQVCQNGRCGRIGDVCRPSTCQELGFECDQHDNGCGRIINCGRCGNREDCVVGHCEPEEQQCRPITCQSLNYECGQYDDRCGEIINCGRCGNREDCVNGRCQSEEEQCRPRTCQNLGYTCGNYSDGCNDRISCGRCRDDQDCVNGRCQEREEECQPRICQNLGYECGNYADGCNGTMRCGNCPGDEDCDNGRCVRRCVPRTCNNLGYECNRHSNGCGGIIDCGRCGNNQDCSNGHCVDVCEPNTCQEFNLECGNYADGCNGTMRCGSCQGDEDCDNGRCVRRCVPRTCQNLGYECDRHNNGCGGTVDCGRCRDGFDCDDGHCVRSCVPDTCDDYNLECGNWSDGCDGTMRCGSCRDDEDCDDGQCIGNCEPDTCRDYNLDCGNWADGCGGTMRCGSCRDGFDCEDGRCEREECRPRSCQSMGYDCGRHDNGCNRSVSCGECRDRMRCVNGRCR